MYSRLRLEREQRDMALVQEGFRLVVSIADTGFNITTRSYQLRGTTSALATADAAALLPTLIAVTDGAIVAYQIVETFTENAVVLPTGGRKITDQALVTVNIAGFGNKKASFNIPVPKDTIFVAAIGTNRDVVDLSDTALIAFSDQFKTTGSAFISDGESLNNMFAGKRISRGSRTG